MAFYESRLASILIQILQNWLDDHDLGIVVGEAGMMRLASRLVRIPDVSFVSWEQLPDRLFPAAPIPHLHPDLAVEVYSKGNTRAEMKRKCKEYFAAGAALVWIVFPVTRTVEVYTSPTEFTVLKESDTLTGEPVLPGFRLSIRDWFRRAGKQARA